MNLSSIETQVVSLCEEVGNFIRVESERFDRSSVELKGNFTNLVSYVDKESERRLVQRLTEIIPHSGCLGEEGANIIGSSGYQWIIDPLDGTTNFVHGFPMFSISIGLLHENTLKLGVVYDVMHRECFHASEGGKAYCNRAVIGVSGEASFQQSLFATGFPYASSPNAEKHLDIIRHFLKSSHGIRRLGSAALDLAYVACGRLEGFFEHGLNAWDVAGGAFVLQQAGGIVTDFSGKNNFLFSQELCAASNLVHAEMLEAIRERWRN